jgi:16S rRNA C967 or C1407 C5-methylase (RsmB/RsmF family)
MVFPLFFLILQSNMQLPEVFVRETKQLMGEERFRRFMEAFNEDAPVSIRLNPLKGGGTQRDGSFVTSSAMSQKNRPSVFPLPSTD